MLHLYVECNSVGCLSTRTAAVFYSTLFVLYQVPNVRHARSRCSRLVSWVTTTTTAVTFVVFETTFNFLTKESLRETTINSAPLLQVLNCYHPDCFLR